jgi:broad specificity phosphatase PhoE
MRLREFLSGLADTPGPVAAVTHGGVTVDLLRNLLGDDAVPLAQVMAAGIPPCAVMNLRHRHERVIVDICTPDQGCRYPQSFAGIGPSQLQLHQAQRARAAGLGCPPGP